MRGRYPVLHSLILTISLCVLWLLLSGIYTPLLLGLGLASVALVVWVALKLEVIDGESVPTRFLLPGYLGYLFWLLVEIARADWAVTKVVLAVAMPIRQRIIRVACTQDTNIGKVTFANSITLTPGTITVETEPDHFLVHCLTDDAADLDALADMDTRVSAVERRRET